MKDHSVLNGFIGPNHQRIEDVYAYVKAWLQEHPNGKIFVGADSKVRGEIVKYATAICLWDIGRGVSEIYRNMSLPKPKDRFSRLWKEVSLAVEVAENLKELGEITVHIDINSNPAFKSHQLFDASIGWISSLGFKADGKPNSWAASCGAHKRCQ